MPRGLGCLGVLIFGGLLLGISGLLWKLREADAPAPWLAFTSDRSGNWEIYRILIDGSGLEQLTYNIGADDWPSWSPDGKWIAFRSTRFGNQQLYRMQPDGRRIAQLTDLQGVGPPFWSPDSEWIATPAVLDGRDGLYRLGWDGSALQGVTVALRGILAFQWTNDAEWMLVQSFVKDNSELLRMRSNGQGWVNLTRDPARDRYGVAAPDGAWVVFVSDRVGHEALYRMQMDGTELGYLHATMERSPLWSPDSQWLYFLWTEEGQIGFYRIGYDGRNVARLADADGSESFITVSPDGRYLAFVRRGLRMDSLFLLEIATGRVVRLTDETMLNAISPTWGPLLDTKWRGEWLIIGAGGLLIGGLYAAWRRLSRLSEGFLKA